MPRIPLRPVVRHLLFMLLACLAAAVPLATRTPPASAHAELLRSEPPIEGLLAGPPRKVDLWFSEAVASTEGSPTVGLLDQTGADLPISDVQVDSKDPKHVVATAPEVSPGTLTVVWSARSVADGHTLTGSFAFRVGAGRVPGSATTDGETPRAWAVATRWLTFLGAAMAAGGFAFALLILRPGDDRRAGLRVRSALIAGSLLAALVASLAEPVLLTRWPPAGMVAPGLADAIASLPAAWWLRPAALAPALICALVAVRLARAGRPAPPMVGWIAIGSSLTTLLGLVLTSHAAGRSSWRWAALLSDGLHQASVALWIGGLAVLTLWRIGSRGGQADTGIGSDGPIRRFSRVALGLVAVAVVTGSFNAGLVLPSLRSLQTSGYGNALLLKVAVLVLPLLLATFNRRALRRLITARSAMERRLRIEVPLTLLVVLGGSILALSAPPAAEVDAKRPTVADVPMPAFAAYRGQDLLVHLRFSPGRTGANVFTVGLNNYDRTPFLGDAPTLVQLRFLSLGAGVESGPIDAQPTPDGWTVSGTQASLDGWWEVRVTLRWLGLPDVVTPFYLLLPDPNLNGLDAPDVGPSNDQKAADLYAAAMATYTGMHRVRYTQAMASHKGSVAFGEHVVNDGSDGSVPGFTYTAPGGWSYVVLGETGWSRLPGEPWKVGKVNPAVPPSKWDDEYVGATGFRIGRGNTGTVGGEACRILTFVVPGTPKQVVAWYAWWVGTVSGQVRREMMVSQSHYMLSTFSDVDAPVTIRLPDDAPSATPAT